MVAATNWPQLGVADFKKRAASGINTSKLR
jgi:hypothetical protein